MPERSRVRAVNEDEDDDSTVTEPTISKLVTSLQSAFQKAAFARAEEASVCREDKLKKDIEKKDEENKLLKEKLQIEALEKLKYQKECAELKVLVSRLREERDGLSKRLKENSVDKIEIFVLRKKNRELECAKRIAETQVSLCNGRFKALEEKLLNLEKEFELGENGEKRDALVNLPLDTNAEKKEVSKDVESQCETRGFDSNEKMFSETNSHPSVSSSHRKMPVK